MLVAVLLDERSLLLTAMDDARSFVAVALLDNQRFFSKDGIGLCPEHFVFTKSSNVTVHFDD